MIIRALAACVLLSLSLGAQVQKGSIEGRVIDAATGQPVPGVAVVPTCADRRGPVKTRADGRFRFEDLPATMCGLLIDTESGYLSRGTVLTLGAGAKLTGIELKAYMPAVVSGRVLDAQQRPVARATVYALESTRAFGRYPRQIRGPTRTNELGEYRISGLVPASYTLVAARAPLTIKTKILKGGEDPADFTPSQAEVTTYYPSSSSQDNAEWFAVAPGQILDGMDIRIAREDTVCIQSRVFDPERARVIGLQVESASFFTGSVIATGWITSGEGFELCGLPRGDFRLQAQAGRRYASQRFEIDTRGTRLPDMHLEPLFPVPGHLTIDAEAGKLPLRRPVSVLLESIDRAWNPGESLSTQVKGEGEFAIPAAMRDEYWLSIGPPPGFYVKSATMAGRDVLHEPVSAGAGELSVVLGQDAASLSVQVSDPDGHPAGSAVLILGRDPLPTHRFGLAHGELTFNATGQDGRAVFNSIEPGRYRLLVIRETWDNASAMSPEFFNAHRAEAQEIKLGPRETQSVRLTLR